ncbi:MAG TPA: glutamate--tRNA ligase, partial [Paludibacteraceae bacterium]|nr:glutamate--tRNA ligase [Paludibacteraceae bacterium]
RVSFVNDIWNEVNYMFEAPTEYDEKSVKKRWKPESSTQIPELMQVLEGLDFANVEENEKTVLAWIESKGYNLGGVMNAFRVAVVGAARGPQMFDIINILGKEETYARVKRALEVLK